MPKGQTERQRDGGCDADRHEGEDDVLVQAMQDARLAGPVRPGREVVHEFREGVHRDRRHGVISQPAPTMSKSAVIASNTQRTAAVSASALK